MVKLNREETITDHLVQNKCSKKRPIWEVIFQGYALVLKIISLAHTSINDKTDY